MGNRTDARQPQQLPGVGAGQWLPSPSTVGAWAGGFFQPPWEEVAYAGVHTPFGAGLSSNLASEVMNDPVPAAHLCGTATLSLKIRLEAGRG